MITLFNKKLLSALLVIASLGTMNFALEAEDYCCPSECNNNRLYIGGFGGQLFSTSTKFVQTGTAFFTEAEGGPLAILARGHSRRNSSGFGGAQIGYEWRKCECSDWSFSPGAEVEAFFYSHKHKAHLLNPSVRLPEHDFSNRFPTDVGVYLFNGVLSLNHSCLGSFTPYVGGGIGAANICIRKARSLQVSPPEVGVNHFDSDRTDVTWTFAAQAKAGVRYNFCERFHIFAEYRYLFVDSSRFLFGSTISPGHVPTTTWNVDMKNLSYNSYAIGIQFDL